MSEIDLTKLPCSNNKNAAANDGDVPMSGELSEPQADSAGLLARIAHLERQDVCHKQIINGLIDIVVNLIPVMKLQGEISDELSLLVLRTKVGRAEFEEALDLATKRKELEILGID